MDTLQERDDRRNRILQAINRIAKRNPTTWVAYDDISAQTGAPRLEAVAIVNDLQMRGHAQTRSQSHCSITQAGVDSLARVEVTAPVEMLAPEERRAAASQTPVTVQKTLKPMESPFAVGAIRAAMNRSGTIPPQQRPASIGMPPSVPTIPHVSPIRIGGATMPPNPLAAMPAAVPESGTLPTVAKVIIGAQPMPRSRSHDPVTEVLTAVAAFRALADLFPSNVRTRAMEHLTDLADELMERRKPSRLDASSGALVLLLPVGTDLHLRAQKIAQSVRQYFP